MGAKTSFQTAEMAVCLVPYKSETLIHLKCISSSSLSEILAQWRSRITVCTPPEHSGNEPLMSARNLPQRRSVWCWKISLTHPITSWFRILIVNPRSPNVESGELAVVLLSCINIFIPWRYLLSLCCWVAEKIEGSEENLWMHIFFSFLFFSFLFLFLFLFSFFLVMVGYGFSATKNSSKFYSVAERGGGSASWSLTRGSVATKRGFKIWRFLFRFDCF